MDKAQEKIADIICEPQSRYVSVLIGGVHEGRWEHESSRHRAKRILQLLYNLGYHKLPKDRPKLREEIANILEYSFDCRAVGMDEKGNIEPIKNYSDTVADSILALIPELRKDRPPLLSDDDEIMAKLWGKAQTETENPMCEYDATECVMILVALAQWDIWNEWYGGK